ncbi:HTH-type transcriptional regulator MalT [Anaerolineae bacterium]|nr:HTH-type transcriptional regulator MalT [Anaerolineae bacterium]
MQKTDPLIRTKLRLPFTRSELVPRSRLQEQIAQGLRGPLTLVIAPAGFGKTTLVTSSIATCGMPVAWLSLDKDDNLAGRFLNYVVAALQTADQTIGSEAAQLMAGMQPASPEAVLSSLINDLDATGREIALVLDDYHFITGQAVHEQVAFLVDHCPGTFHLVIAARSDPLLPLARLRARGQTVELRAADLRFTAPEAAQFLNDVMGLRLDAESITVLEERTEGWIAGLQMAALSMRDRNEVRGFIAGFSGTNRFILDYLLEEVLAREPEDVQAFLLQTSILTRFTGPLCDAVTGVSGSQEMIEKLEKRNLFVVPLDEERRWYRYHHLFADLLKARLYQSEPDRVARLFSRAAAWCEQEGQIAEAVDYALAAHEIDRAAELIERYGPTRWIENDPSVMQMADNLPLELLLTRPKIGLYQALLLIFRGQAEKAIPLLKDLTQHLSDTESDSRLRWIPPMIALVLAFLSGSYALPDYQALDEISAGEPILRDTADLLYGMTLGRRGQFDRAVEVTAQRLQRQKIPRGTPVIPNLVPFLARLYLMEGRLHAADALCRDFLDPIQEKGFRFNDVAGGLQVVRGEVLHEWNCLDEAEKDIRDGFQVGEPWHNIMVDAFGLLALIRVFQAKANYTGAMQMVEKFETTLRGQFGPFEFAEDVRTLRVRAQLASGDLQSASDWADRVQLTDDFQRHQERYTLTLARIRLAQNRYTEVEKMLIGFTPPVSAGNRITRQIEVKLLLATAIAGQRSWSETFPLIEACLVLAESEGYIQVFLESGEPVRELLVAYLRSDVPGHKPYAQRILDAFPLTSPLSSPGSQPAGLIEPLSGREREVLQLIATGKTNQQIARQLIVSPGTVKAHTASIYRKLDVANRTEAVARARQLGLLS